MKYVIVLGSGPGGYVTALRFTPVFKVPVAIEKKALCMSKLVVFYQSLTKSAQVLII
jgi:hypothetical protein